MADISQRQLPRIQPSGYLR